MTASATFAFTVPASEYGDYNHRGGTTIADEVAHLHQTYGVTTTHTVHDDQVVFLAAGTPDNIATLRAFCEQYNLPTVPTA